MLKRIEADWLARPGTQAVFDVLARAGYDARAVGGSVRNALIGAPVEDIDIATTATPDEVSRLAAAAGLRVIATGLQHGTVTVISEGIPYEVTTLREDVATFGRHAEVAFTADWIADASRRDFTMNALYCEADGALFDPLGGLADLEARRVRFIGDPHARIREDYLRILRFFRFFGQYGNGAPEEADMLACVQERKGLRQLSRERIRQEMVKLVCAPRAMAAIEAMHTHGILTELLPVAPAPATFAAVTRLDRDQDAALRLAGLCVHVDEDAARLAGALRLSNTERRTLASYAMAAAWTAGFPDPRTQRALCYRLGRASYKHFITGLSARRAQQDTSDMVREALVVAEQWAPPQFPLKGADVIAAGIRSGPEVGKILSEIEELWIDMDFAMDRAQLIAELTKRVQSLLD